MVETTHPGHLGEGPGFSIEDHGVSGLALVAQGRVGAVGRPGWYVDDVIGLLVGEEGVVREALRGPGHRRRTEPQVADVRRNRDGGLQHTIGHVPVDGQGDLGDGSVLEIGGSEERDGGLLVVHIDVDRVWVGSGRKPDPVGNALEAEPS